MRKVARVPLRTVKKLTLISEVKVTTFKNIPWY
jgi:hypothetical protein